jgi:hypothetical protein
VREEKLRKVILIDEKAAPVNLLFQHPQAITLKTPVSASMRASMRRS